VNRIRINTTVSALRDKLLDDDATQTMIAEFLEARERRRLCLIPRHDYLRFVSRYAAQFDTPWWSKVFRLNGFRVRVVGLCSSWMAKGKGDRGKLLVGRWQVNRIPPADDSNVDFRIILLHHRWAYLAEYDAHEIEEIVHKQADLVLRGHTHTQRSWAISYPQDAFIEHEAGSAYEDSRYANSFQMIELYPNVGKMRVQYWVWFRYEWVVVKNMVPGAPAGIAVFPLMCKRREAPGTSTTPERVGRSTRG